MRHAFRVAASLDSMVMGEPQILGQVKEAYDAAEKAGSLGSVLNALRNRSVAAAKRARTETGIGRNAVSVSYVAVELARKIFGDLRDRSVLLVGAGKMSELAARQMIRDGARASVLGGRTMEKAEQLAAALGGRCAPLEALRSELARADIVISGTGAPGIVIAREDVEAAQAARRGRPLFLIDIAVPRDVAEDAGKVSGVFLYDLDDIKTVAEANLRERKQGGLRRGGHPRARDPRVPRVAPLARGGAAPRRAAQAWRRDPQDRDREGAPPARARSPPSRRRRSRPPPPRS